MKKSFLLLLALSFILGGCATQNANLSQKKSLEKVAKENMSKKEQKQETQSSQNNNQEKKEINKSNNNMNTVILKTNKGDIKIKLNSEKAPISVENFKAYVSDGFYDGTIFHRVIPDFMIQGGGFEKDGTQKETKDPIKNEATNGLKNDRGTIAMARTMVTDSATSQFFINLKDNDFLNYKDPANYGYAVFGEVIEGMDVVDLIAQVKTESKGGHGDWPTEDIIIESASLVE